jgi:O-antigen/teichoic acid export membrane protein
MNTKRIFSNAAMSMIQTVVTGVVLFFLYRFLLRTIGVGQVGLWALLLATTSFTQIATFGLAGGLVKFVAAHAARGEEATASKLVETALLTISVFMAAVLVPAFPVIRAVLSWIVPSSSLPLAVSLLPFAFVSFWLMMNVSVLLAGLDGTQRISARSVIMMSGTVLHLSLCLWLAPRFGLRGVAFSSVVQNLAVLAGSWLVLRRILPGLPPVPRHWDRKLFREVFSYGVKFQAISVLAMFFEPLTKALLGRFGNLAMLGYYEMAVSMVYKSRELIHSATQTLVPAIADLKERNPERIRSVYEKAYQVLYFLALPMFTLLLVGSPLVSRIWIGHHEDLFVGTTVILCASWFLNSLNLPATVACLGIGDLKLVLTSYAVIAAANLVLGLALGAAFGGFGVVGARAVALIGGGAAIAVPYHRGTGFPMKALMPGTMKSLSGACVLTVLVFVVLWSSSGIFYGKGPAAWIFPALVGLIILLPFWRNPTRKWLADGALGLVPARQSK